VPAAAAPDAGLSSAVCGTDYDGGAANISVGIATLDNAGTSGKMGFQFAHRSTALEGELAPNSSAGFVLGLAQDGGIPDAGPDADPDAAPGTPVTNVTVIGASKYSPTTVVPVPAAQFAGLDKDQTTLGIYFPNPDGGAPSIPLFTLNLDTISFVSTGVKPTAAGGDGGPSIFVDGMNYTIVLLGDKQYTAPDTRSPHVIAFPNDPVVPSL